MKRTTKYLENQYSMLCARIAVLGSIQKELLDKYYQDGKPTGTKIDIIWDGITELAQMYITEKNKIYKKIQETK